MIEFRRSGSESFVKPFIPEPVSKTPNGLQEQSRDHPTSSKQLTVEQVRSEAPISPEEKVNGLKSGNSEMWGLTLERQRGLAIADALNHRLSYEDAEDLAQEAAIKAFRFRDKLDGTKGNPDYYVSGIVFKNRIDFQRFQNRRRNVRVTLPIDSVPISASYEDVIVERIDSQRREEIVREALRQIPAKQAEALLLTRSGYTYAESAEMLGVRISTLKTRVQLGLKRLKSLLFGHPELQQL